MAVAGNLADIIRQRVAQFYWQHDRNCATTALCILAELFDLELNQQTIDSAVAMHGAGKYGAQCGLVEGSIMFIGIYGRHNKMLDNFTIEACREFARSFENRFGSLLCKALRPGGFSEADPPHVCEQLTCEAIQFTTHHVSKFLQTQPHLAPPVFRAGRLA
jgi:C_GCAxxG_C_C family probable redox protein